MEDRLFVDLQPYMDTKPLYFLVDGALLYVESPEEALEHGYNPSCAVLRAFLTLEEAETYRNVVAEYNAAPVASYAILDTPLANVYAMLPLTNDRAEYDFGAHLTVALSTIRPNEFPKRVEILWEPHTLH